MRCCSSWLLHDRCNEAQVNGSWRWSRASVGLSHRRQGRGRSAAGSMIECTELMPWFKVGRSRHMTRRHKQRLGGEGAGGGGRVVCGLAAGMTSRALNSPLPARPPCRLPPSVPLAHQILFFAVSLVPPAVLLVGGAYLARPRRCRKRGGEHSDEERPSTSSSMRDWPADPEAGADTAPRSQRVRRSLLPGSRASIGVPGRETAGAS